MADRHILPHCPSQLLAPPPRRLLHIHGVAPFHVLAPAPRSHPPHPPLQISYAILQRVSPVTHSIGNCVKRVIVIVASVFVFQNPMSTQNVIGAHGAFWGHMPKDVRYCTVVTLFNCCT